MTTTLTDPRTEQVLSSAADIDHVVCLDCWTPGMPVLCGEDYDHQVCLDDCTCPTCPLCEVEWARHERSHLPWWKRWFS